MLQTVEVEIDVDGSVRWLEPLHLSKRSRGYVTILQEPNGISPSQGNAAAALKFLRENRLPDAARPSVEEIEAQIIEARESWD